MVTVRDKKGDKLIQLKDATSFENKYTVRLPFKEILGIRIPIRIVLNPNISYKNIGIIRHGMHKKNHS